MRRYLQSRFHGPSPRRTSAISLELVSHLVGFLMNSALSFPQAFSSSWNPWDVHERSASAFPSATCKLNSLCFPPVDFPVIPHTCSTKKRSRRSADILQEVRAAHVPQSRWPLPWTPCRHGDGQIVLTTLLREAADPPRRHRFICTTCVKIQHTAQLAEGLALELGEVDLKTLPMLRSTWRTFHRHTGGGPTSFGMTRNGLRPSPEQRTPSQKACHPQSQPARVIESVAIVGSSALSSSRLRSHTVPLALAVVKSTANPSRSPNLVAD